MRTYALWGVLFLFQSLAVVEAKNSSFECCSIDEVSSSNLQVTDDHFNDSIALLGQMVAYPTVSNPNSSDYSEEQLKNLALKIEARLKGLGFQVLSPSIEGSAPYLIAELGSDETKPTILMYAHYDVQPVDREKWISDPFIMDERDGRLYARGASDDKAGIVSIITAIEVFQRSGIELPVNIKLLFEGEEEYGSPHMKTLLEQYSKELQADALVVLDGLNRDVNTGTLLSSTRGIVNINLKVTALEKPVHSGIGCLAPDPAQALAELVYSFRNPKSITGFLENFQQLNDQEKEILAKSSQTEESYAQEMGLLEKARLRGNPDESIYERIVQEPSVSIVNMNCGHQNGGNSIQESANCMIGIRIMPGQNPEQISENMVKHLQSQPVMFNLPIEISPKERVWAWKADLSGHFSKKYLQALENNFPHSCAMPSGGALPLLREFQAIFPTMEMIVPGVEDSKTSAHSHNESQDISVFRNSINSLIAFLSKAGH